MKLTGPQATILASVIAVIGIASGSFLTPLANKLVNQPTPTANTTSLPIENFPQRVFAYYGTAESLGGFAKLNLLFDGVRKNPYYELNYNIPANQAGYAGIAFQFENGLDVSAYKTLVLAIQFDEIDTSIDFYVKDISGKKGSIRIVSKDKNKLVLRYDLDNFPDVNFHALQEVGLNIQDSFSNGEYTVTIHSISFEK